MRKKGMTLIEVVISIAILGIIAASFLTMFSNGFSNIFIAGNRTRALAKAQEIIDKAYSVRETGAYDTKLSGISSSSTLSNIYNYEAGKTSKYNLKDHPVSYEADGTFKNDTYKELTVVVFYQRGKRYVVLRSLLPSGGVQ